MMNWMILGDLEWHFEKYPIWVWAAKLTSCLTCSWSSQPVFFRGQLAMLGAAAKYTCHPLLRQHTFLTIEMWRSGPTNLVMVHTNSFELLLYIHHPSQELLRTSATAHANSFGETQCVPHPRCTRSDGSLWQTLGRPICCALSKSEGPPQPSLTYQFNISTICAYAKMYVYTYTT